MKLRGVLIGVAMALVAVPGQVLATWDPGDWVLARWKDGPYWFPGVVQQHRAGNVTVHYDDGTIETLPESRVKRYDWAVGSRIQCVWASDGGWYAASITNMGNDGTTLMIRYEDGTVERTKTGQCRSQ